MRPHLHSEPLGWFVGTVLSAEETDGGRICTQNR